ncbi:MAG TPA: type VI secretion system-associated FHA domain protein TagH [Steroidobacteraceae bacterium]|nr:type VI secretion system-associated FHA domain protein TagH [Steroidobacteraceae bacterium]
MALRLTVVSEQRGTLGRNASIVLGVGGGSIGRAHDNDWVLPDVQCYVSAHHARVQFRNGGYYLLDTSTNGVYVNGANTPISPRNIYPLRNGDYLRFGEYEVAVNIDMETADAPEASSIFPVGAATAPSGKDASDIGIELDVQELLQTGAGLQVGAASRGRAAAPRAAPAHGASARMGPVDAYGQPVSVAAVASAAGGAVPSVAAGAVPGVAAGLASMRPAPRREPRASLEPTGRHRSLAPAPIEQAAVEAFCRGAGLESRRVPPEAQSRLLYLGGLLLREALAGLKGLALAQRELRDQARLSTGREDPQHIGLTGLPVEDLMLRLLLGHDRHELDAVQWLRDLAGNSRAYDQSLMRALPAALAEFIARLDPRALAQSAQGGAEAESTGVTARFRSITESSVGALPQLFVEALARAFAAEFARGARDRGGRPS